ncbi:MAG: oligosaccharide flippase family protein [Candidatus Paceibacterota bacterium]
MFFIQRTKALITKSLFFKDLLILMSGTVVAQVITVFVSPILTRLFSPSAFGVFGVYMSVVAIVTAVVTMRYDQALMLPKKNKDAAHLFWASLLSVSGVSVVSLILCVLFFKQIPFLLEVPELRVWVLFLPFSIFFAGFYLTLNSWSTRQKKFKRASISQVIRSSAAAGIQVSSGIAKVGPVGLIGGAIVGDFFSSLALAVQVEHSDKQILREGLHRDSIIRMGREYSDFPIYSSAQNFLNAISQNVPVLLLAKFFGPVVVGYYALGVRVLQLPISLILTSLRQVLFQKASEVHNNEGDTYSLFKKTTLGLLALVVIPALLIIIYGPFLFGFVLGRNWVIAGEYARWLVLWLAVGFVNPPAILFAQIYRKQKFLFFQDLVLLIFRVAVLVIGGLYFNPLRTIIMYSIIGVIFNSFVILYMWGFIRSKQHKNRL